MVTRGASCPFPIEAQPLAGIELALREQTARKQPAER
jgi:hypothetical protein